MTVLPGQDDLPQHELARPAATIIPASPRMATAHPPARQPDIALATAGAACQHWRTELLLMLPALPACDRHAELRTPELADLREATRTDGAGIAARNRRSEIARANYNVPAVTLRDREER